MLRMFSQRMGDALRAPADAKLSPQQVITLASIVEREAKVPSERADHRQRVPEPHGQGHAPAGGSDRPVRGGDPRRPAAARYDYWRNLTPDDLTIASPYNTYVNQGSAARPDLQSWRSLDPRRAAARSDGLPVLRRQTRRQRYAPVCQDPGRAQRQRGQSQGPVGSSRYNAAFNATPGHRVISVSV